jgi:hypothetical protein
MGFYPVEDKENGLSLTGICWQECGTGDAIVSAAKGKKFSGQAERQRDD